VNTRTLPDAITFGRVLLLIVLPDETPVRSPSGSVRIARSGGAAKRRRWIAATANQNMTAVPTTTRFLWALADLSAVIIANVRIYSAEAGSFQFFQGPATPNGSDRPPLETTSLLAGTTLRGRKIWHTATHQILAWPPCRPGGLQNSAGVAAFLAGRAVPANNSDLRAVRHTELAHDLPHMNFNGTFPHPQPARYNLVRVALAQEFEDHHLPLC
jgi:hypothetical protein